MLIVILKAINYKHCKKIFTLYTNSLSLGIGAFGQSFGGELLDAVGRGPIFTTWFTTTSSSSKSKQDIPSILLSRMDTQQNSSKNILDVLDYCKKKRIFTISVTGFAGKRFQKKSNINLDIGIKNYGITEDFFQIIMHMLTQSIRLKFIKIKSKEIL